MEEQVQHWTVAETDHEGTVDLAAAHLVRVHYGSHLWPEPHYSQPWVTKKVTSNTGWSISVGGLPAHNESFLALTPPEGKTLVCGLTSSISAGIRQVTASMTPPLYGLFNRSIDPVDPEVRAYDNDVWVTAVRVYQIGINLPAPTAPPLYRSGKSSGLLDVAAHQALSWARFRSEEATAPWKAAGITDAISVHDYAQAGCDPVWSKPWTECDYSPAEARELDAKGWTGALDTDLRYLTDPADERENEHYEVRAAWHNSGLPARLAVLACAAGFTVTEAQTSPDLDESTLWTLAILHGVDFDGLYLDGVPTNA